MGRFYRAPPRRASGHMAHPRRREKVDPARPAWIQRGHPRPGALMKIRSTIALILLLAAAAACDDGKKPTPDAAVVDIGFNKPTAALKANDNNLELGPADLTCLGTASTDMATMPAMTTLSTTVKDFQNNTAVPNAGVTAFKNADVGAPFDTKTADATGKVSIAIPAGTKRFGFKMTDGSSLDTLLLNQKVDPNMPMQTVTSIQIVSRTTATLLPALINKN